MGTVSLPLLHWSEGFTIDVVIRVVNRLVFNAQQIRTVLLVYAVTRATQASRPGLSFWQACVGGFKLLPTLARSDLFFQATLGLLAFTLVLKGNKLLDRAARNNFTRDLKGWHWSASDDRREIVLITGGAGRAASAPGSSGTTDRMGADERCLRCGGTRKQCRPSTCRARDPGRCPRQGSPRGRRSSVSLFALDRGIY